jgi:hypothetical protein
MDGIQAELEDGFAVVGRPASILLKDPPGEALRSGTVFDVIDAFEERYPETICGFASHDVAA